MASAELRADFDRCTTLFKDFLAQDKLNGTEHQIGAVSVDRGKTLSYVPKDQWHSMSQAEQDQVKADRVAKKARHQAQGDSGKGSGGGKNGKPTSKGKQMKFKDKRIFNRAVKKEVTRQIKALSQKPTAGVSMTCGASFTRCLVIPLQLNGVTSAFTVRTPSRQEYDQSEFVFEMTAESPDWDPQDLSLAQQEAAMSDLRGH
ncbi:hypothetical protein ACHAXA_011326, partial [Cyclostephanos tholiformis]